MTSSRIESLVFSSNLNRTAALLGTIFVLTSLFYVCVDWYWYYNSRAVEKELDAAVVAQSVREIVRVAHDHTSAQESLSRFLKSVNAKMVVSASSGGQEVYNIENNYRLDLSRTQIIKQVSFEEGATAYLVKYQVSNRPNVITALARSWFFSLYDLITAPGKYMQYKLYNRSTPLLAAMFIVSMTCVPWFRYWRKIYEERQGLHSQFKATQKKLDDKIKELSTRKSEIDIVRRDKENELESMRRHIQDHSTMSEKALFEMQEKIKNLSDENAQLWSENDSIENQLTSLKTLQKEKSEIEEKWAIDKSKLVETATQLQEFKQMILNLSVESANQTVITKDSRVYKKLKEQLKKWVQSPGNAKISLADHGTKGHVDKYVSKIDRDFIDEYFVIVKSDEYSPAEKGCIKVSVAPEGAKDYSGTISVYLDTDSGCSIALSYKTKDKSPTEKVGFVLAIMLKAVCKEFEGYRIK